jgi:hypothetical protein
MSKRIATSPARGMVPARLIVFGLVGIAVIAVPLWLMKKEGRAKIEKAEAAERAAMTPTAPAPAAATAPTAEPAAPAAPNNPDRFGLSFGWAATPSADGLIAGCHGEPRQFDNPHSGSCNPYAGDTSCRTELPLLCSRNVTPNELALATTRGVAGFLLASRADGDARCVAELGAGWRMAGFHDGGGWEMRGQRDAGSGAATHQRAWVAIGDQAGNCWDPAR